jgi:hypothetical protein
MPATRHAFRYSLIASAARKEWLHRVLVARWGNGPPSSKLGGWGGRPSK